MKIEGILEQNGIPTPDNPVDIKTGVVVIVEGKKIIIPFDEFILKEGDRIEKINGEWYLIKGGNL